MQVLCVSTLPFICYLFVLGSPQVNGGAFPETDAMKAGYESVHKIIYRKTDYSKNDYIKDLQKLKDQTYNDAAQAVGDQLIPEFAEFLKENPLIKHVIDMIGFTIIVFTPEVVAQGKELNAAYRIEMEPNFETMVMDQVFAKGPVFGMGTSFKLDGNKHNYLMTFTRGNKILDKFMDMLKGRQILVSATATVRAVKYRADRVKGKKLDKESHTYGFFTILRTPCNQPENAESIVLAAISILQQNSASNLHEVFITSNQLIHYNNVNKDTFEGVIIVSYGFSLWYRDGFAYLGIFYKRVPLQNDAFPVPPTACEDKISYIPPSNSTIGWQQKHVNNGTNLLSNSPASDDSVKHEASNVKEKEEEDDQGDRDEDEDEEAEGSNSEGTHDGVHDAKKSASKSEEETRNSTAVAVPPNNSTPDAQHEDNNHSAVKLALVTTVFELINEVRDKAGKHMKKHWYKHKENFSPPPEITESISEMIKIYAGSDVHPELAELCGEYSDELRASRIFLFGLYWKQFVDDIDSDDKATVNLIKFSNIVRPLLELKTRLCTNSRTKEVFNVTRREVISVEVIVNTESSQRIFMGIHLGLKQKNEKKRFWSKR